MPSEQGDVQLIQGKSFIAVFSEHFGLTLSKVCNEFVIHTSEIDYDFHYCSDIRSKIIELLGGMNTRDLGFIRPLSEKLFKKLILIK